MQNAECKLVSLWRYALLSVVVATAVLQAKDTVAAGEEFTRSGDDLVVTVTTKWAGCSHGGYYPIRVMVKNRGIDCTLSVAFSGQEGAASARRTIAVAQNATVKFTLPVPVVGAGTYGELVFSRNGRLVKGLRENLSIPDMHSGGTSRPSLLVISPSNVDFDPFESAITSKLPEVVSGGGPSYGRYGGYHGIASENHERVEPTLLPEEWIAYSGLDIVAVPLQTLGKFTESERSALLKWVHTGGSLIVYQVGDAAARSRELNDLLDLDQHAAVSAEWQPSDPAQRRKIQIVDTDDYGGVLTAVEDTEAESAAAEVDFVWTADSATFGSRELMLGHVFAFRDNPFPGSAHDWNWFLQDVPADAKTWTGRHGITSRFGSDEFLQFLIPSVRGVPVMAFLLLITLFTVVIGPLNYVFLWKRRRLYLLVLTIPLIALVTSLSLFGYSAVAHGFSTKSRARTVTFVDQDAKAAVSVGRLALYAGLAPSDGLRFSSDTAVNPIWPEDHNLESVTTDWTEQQNLRSGWLNSRTRTQFLTVSHRDERGRLDAAASGERLKITNGFEWGFEALVVSDAAGRFYYGADIPAGASAELSLMTAEQRREFGQLMAQHPLQQPDVRRDRGGMFDWDISSYYNYDPSGMVSFNTGNLEKLMSRVKTLKSGGGVIPSNSYAAVLTENPGIEMGVDRTRPQASLHVLMGQY